MNPAQRLQGIGKDTIADGGSIAPEGPNRHKRTLSNISVTDRTRRIKTLTTTTTRVYAVLKY